MTVLINFSMKGTTERYEIKRGLLAFYCYYLVDFYDDGIKPLARTLYPASVPRLVPSPAFPILTLLPALDHIFLFYFLYTVRPCLKT